MKQLYTFITILLSIFAFGQDITVTVSASELTNAPGITIVHNYGGWTENGDDVVNNGDGTYSYTFSSVPSGTQIEYIWKAYGNDATIVQENLGTIQLIGNGQYENYLLADIPAKEALVTDYFSYGNRTVTSDGNNYTAQAYYFHSIRRPGINYPELTLVAPSGKTAFIRSSLNWDQPQGAGGKDNGDGTYTAIVLPTGGFEYMWTYDGTQEDLSPNPNGGQNCSGDATIVNAGSYFDANGVQQYFGNRVHTAGESRTDTFNTCPTGTLSINNLELGVVEFYPNPMQNTLNVSSSTMVESIGVYDLTGRQVLSAMPNAAAFSLNVSNLNKGVYLVSIKADGQEMTAKLVK